VDALASLRVLMIDANPIETSGNVFARLSLTCLGMRGCSRQASIRLFLILRDESRSALRDDRLGVTLSESIVELHLGSNELVGGDMEAFASLIARPDVGSEADVGYDDTYEHVGSLFNLAVLNLQMNGIGPAGGEALIRSCGIPRRKTAMTLDLSGNCVGEGVAAGLVHVYRARGAASVVEDSKCDLGRGLGRLIVQKNGISKDDVEALLELDPEVKTGFTSQVPNYTTTMKSPLRSMTVDWTRNTDLRVVRQDLQVLGRERFHDTYLV
jgi:hypothetical protein